MNGNAKEVTRRKFSVYSEFDICVNHGISYWWYMRISPLGHIL